MFLRKLTVIVVPLVMMAVLCFVVPLMNQIELFFFTPVFKGIFLGIALALILPVSGASRKREPFAGLLWIPAFLTLLMIVWQYVASTGVSLPVLDLIRTADNEVLLVEAIVCAFLFTQCFRTGK